MKKYFTLLFALMAVITVNAEEWYLVGDGTPIGWEGDSNLRQSTRMTETSEGVFVWTGLLKHGGEGFKICDAGWNGYHPSTQGLAISGTGSDTYTEDNGADWKWNPENEDWVCYTITLDKNAGTLSWEPAEFTVLEASEDGVISIGTAEELNTLAFMTRNNINGDSYNVKLTADIDYTAYTNGSMSAIGVTEKFPFKGDFDGQNYTITVDLESYSTRFSIFGTIIGKVHNLKVDGKITATVKNQTGGICGLLKGDGSKIYNCISAAEIVDEQSGDGTIAGICAVTYDASTIENCAFYGKISAPSRDGNGGIISWANSGASTTIKNCLVVADINWADGADFGRNNPSVINSFKTDASDETLANGQMTYKLNNYVSGAEDWFQTLETDDMPSPLSSSAKLYANGAFYCDGVTPKEGVEIVLSNTDETTIDDHNFGENGICQVCLAAGQEPAILNGVFRITNAGNLLWWAAYVNAGNPDASATVTADIDMTGIKYVPAGTSEYKYVGTFDGKGHAITLDLNNPDLNYQGLIGVATDGATIQNVIVKGTVVGNSYVAGIVGGSNGSADGETLNIINCGNEATITAANANGAGIIGVNMGSAAHFYISNCYNIGNVTSNRESGAITGWTGGDKTTIENTYNIGVVTNGEGDGFIRGGGNIVNTYNLAADDAQVASGALCDKLGNGFRQNIGEDAYPIFDKTHNVVKEISEAGYATMFVSNAVEVPEGVTANTCTIKAENGAEYLNLNPVEGPVTVWEPVVLKGAPGIYSFTPAAGTEKSVTVDFSALGFENEQELDGSTICVEDIDINFETGTGTTTPKYYTNGTAARFYGGNIMSIYALGQTITKIEFTFKPNANTPTSENILFNEGDYDVATKTWTGSAENVILSRKIGSGHFRFVSMTVTYLTYPANNEDNVLSGTYENIQAAGKYVLAQPEGKKVGFYLAETGTLKAGKAYFEGAVGVKAFYFDDEDATGIETLSDSSVKGENIYNIAGQRVSKIQKGINIINGKKILK